MARKTALAILIAARKLIAPREAWIKGEFGHAANGRSVLTPHPDAVAFCSVGAIRQAGADADVPRKKARALLAKEMKGDVLDFNDDPDTTHRQVLSAFDRAIRSIHRAANVVVSHRGSPVKIGSD